MLEFHDIIEGWLLDSSEERLSPWKARLLRRHLEGCARCQAFAKELVEFSYDVESAPRKERLSAEDASLLHSRVMAAFQRERQAERKPAKKLYLRTYFGVRPQFAKAHGVVALVLGLILMLSQARLNQLQDSSVDNAAPQSAPALDPLPAATASAAATMSPTPALSPEPSPKP